MATKQGISIFNEKLSVQLNADVFDKATDNTVSIKAGDGIKVTSDKGLVLDKTVVTNIAATEVAKIVDGAPEAYNTLKEIADYIKGDITGAANMQNAINANAEAIKTKQDKLGTGSGIVITEDNIITVDGSQLTVKLATNAINATNDANGKSITATYATKTEMQGVYDTIEGVNNTVKLHTTSIENLTNDKQDKLDFENGLTVVGNRVSVATTVLQDIADNKKNIGTLSDTVGKLEPTVGDLKTTVNTLSNNIGNKQDTLTFGSGLTYETSTKKLAVSDTLMTQVTTNKTRIGALESTTQKTLTPENGVYIDASNKIGVKHDDTLKVSDSGLIGVYIGSGLKQGTNLAVAVNVGDGITCDADDSIKVNHDDTLAITSDGKLQVKESAIANIAAAKVAEIVAGAPDKYDTLKEIADYIKSDEANAATMSNDIAEIKGWGDHAKGGYAKSVMLGSTKYNTDAQGRVILPAYPTSLPANGGNADTANKLTTPRNLWGQDFDGSGDVAGIMREVGTIHFGNQSYGERGIYQGNWYTEDLTEEDIALYFARTYFAGNVGIGTTRPSQKLHVLGDTYIEGTTMTYSHQYVRNGGGLSHGGDTYAWYTVYQGEISTMGDNILLNLSHNYYHSVTDAVTFSINVGYGKASIVQLNAIAGTRIFQKVRVRWVDAKYVFVDVRIYSHVEYTDTIYAFGTGAGKFQKPMPTSDDTGIISESEIIYDRFYASQAYFDAAVIGGNTILHTDNFKNYFSKGFTPKSDGTLAISTSYIASAIKGNGLVVNDSGLSVESAPKLSTLRKIWGQSFDGSGDVSGSIDNCNWVRCSKDSSGSGFIIGRGEEISGTSGLGLWTSGDAPIFFGAGSAELMRIAGNGNVGIGTTDPQYKLDVNGSIHTNGNIIIDGVLQTKNHFLLVRNDGADWVVTDRGWEREYQLLHSGNLSDHFTNGFEHVDGALRVSTSYIGENMKGDGLLLGENGRLSVNVGEGFQISDDVIQLKLSTGLAIDSQGYLYVVPSQIANTE